MKEIVHIQVGKCGNSIGCKFWEVICKEHGLNEEGEYYGNDDVLLNGINIHFSETRGLTYRPRSVLIDLDKSTMGYVKNTRYGNIHKRDNLIFGTSGAATNWARGHFTEGHELSDSALNAIRREVECCDCFQGFQMIHSMGGGTGSGLGSLLLSKLYEEYPQNIVNAYSIIPSQRLISSVLEPYNALLTLTHLIEKCHENFLVDKDALHYLVTNFLKIANPNYDHFSHLSALFLSGLTCCMRFPSGIGADFRSIAVNMIPFPQLHFFLPGFAPIVGKDTQLCLRNSVVELSIDFFSAKNVYASFEAKKERYITAGCIYRGNLSVKDIESHAYDIQTKNSQLFVDWIPHKIRSALCSVSPPEFVTSSAFIANTTAIGKIINTTILEKYRIMFLKKAFLHWYLEEGFEEQEFLASEARAVSLVNAYNEYGPIQENQNQPSQVTELKVNNEKSENSTN